MHVRRAIREAVKAKLVEASIVGDHVFSNRVSPIQPHEMPAIVISTPGDTVTVAPGSPIRARRQQRDITVDILIVTRASDDLDDDFDDLAEQIEPVLHADYTLGLGATNLELRSTSTTIVGEGSEPQGVQRLSYVVTVNTREGAPQSMFS